MSPRTRILFLVQEFPRTGILFLEVSFPGFLQISTLQSEQEEEITEDIKNEGGEGECVRG